MLVQPTGEKKPSFLPASKEQNGLLAESMTGQHGESLMWRFASHSYRTPFSKTLPFRVPWNVCLRTPYCLYPPFWKKTHLESQLKLESSSGMSVCSKSTQLRLREKDGQGTDSSFVLSPLLLFLQQRKTTHRPSPANPCSEPAIK